VEAGAPAARAVAVAGTAAWAVLVEPGLLVVDEREITLPGWPAGLAGLRVAAIADVHAGAPHVDERALARLVERTNADRPDLVVLLGDYVIHGVPGGRFMEPERTAGILSGLRAPLGVYAILGNHDHWYDAGRVTAAFEAVGIPVLLNDARPVVRGPATLWVAGMDDLWAGAPDVAGTLRKVPRGAPVLFLTHNPDVFPRLPPSVSLTLAGHTPGGQVWLPLLGAPVVPSAYGQRYAEGRVVEDGRTMFVTSGVGTSILPLRFAVRPEVAVLTLR
jgi:predicted MPP superfamily phosphohydrolase